MTITAEYTSAKQDQVKWSDGVKTRFSSNPIDGSRGTGPLKEWIDAGNSILAYAPPAPTAQDVKNEAQRRIIVLTGATDLTSTMIKQLNALMRATELTNKKAEGQTLTADEQAEDAALTGLADAIKAIRAKSNDIEAMSPIPSDYASDSYWM